ncbi:MAG: hypoxanthine phosphoribosyltransferase, partial [Gemmatimonadales bacterium]
ASVVGRRKCRRPERRRCGCMLPGTEQRLRQTGGRELARVVFDEATLDRRVRELGQQITARYPEGDLLVLGLLKGSFIFLSDLVRRIERPLQVDFLVAASYGSGTESSGTVRLLYDPETELRGRHLLLVEDIIDTGRTLNRLLTLLRAREPRSLEICALLHKHVADGLTQEAAFVGFDAPPAFLVGYGLDHAENFRHLPYIASLD